jgi:hypothetical protein
MRSRLVLLSPFLALAACGGSDSTQKILEPTGPVHNPCVECFEVCDDLLETCQHVADVKADECSVSCETIPHVMQKSDCLRPCVEIRSDSRGACEDARMACWNDCYEEHGKEQCDAAL